MRLKRVATGQRLPQKLLLRFIGMMSDVDDILRVVFYRPEYFGRPYSNTVHAALRGPSEWTVGERELFAAFVSQQNRCAF
jgi:hypothetical protein